MTLVHKPIFIINNCQIAARNVNHFQNLDHSGHFLKILVSLPQRIEYYYILMLQEFVQTDIAQYSAA